MFRLTVWKVNALSPVPKYIHLRASGEPWPCFHIFCTFFPMVIWTWNIQTVCTIYQSTAFFSSWKEAGLKAEVQLDKGPAPLLQSTAEHCITSRKQHFTQYSKQNVPSTKARIQMYVLAHINTHFTEVCKAIIVWQALFSMTEGMTKLTCQC